MGKSLLMAFLMSMMSLVAVAQNNVRGTVVDENGEPVVGATVRVAGTQTPAPSPASTVISVLQLRHRVC